MSSTTPNTKQYKVVFTFKNEEDRNKWYGAYSNSGEQEVFEYWHQDGEDVPEWKEEVIDE